MRVSQRGVHDIRCTEDGKISHVHSWKKKMQMYEKRQDLARPLKKRKAAPNQKFIEGSAPAGAGSQVCVSVCLWQ